MITPEPKTSGWHVVKWCRRGTAIALDLFILSKFVRGPEVTTLFSGRADTIASSLGLTSGKPLLIVVGLIWYAFLTQLKIRWLIFLPVYLFAAPLTWLLVKGGATALKPLVNSIRQVTNADPQATESKVIAKKGLPLKRIWVLLFFIWLLALRGLQAPWAVWLLPFLIVPIWLWSLRLIHDCAVAPRTFANFAITLAQHLLDAAIKALNEAKVKKQQPAGAVHRLFINAAQYVLNRYSPETTLVAIQKEAINIFSLALVLALTLSASFWGLIARGIYRTAPGVLQGYAFFRTGGWVECCLWAVGVMTTSVAFPGAAAPVWLKAIHAGILATGLFQLTYLLACFSIMASAQAERTVHKAGEGIRNALAKMDETKRLQTELTRTIEGTLVEPSQPEPDASPKT